MRRWIAISANGWRCSIEASRSADSGVIVVGAE